MFEKFVTQLSLAFDFDANTIPSKETILKLKSKLQSNFRHYWFQMINKTFNDKSNSDKGAGNKLRTYALFKKTFKCETYLQIRNFEFRKVFAQLRVSAHNLRIEKDRYNKEYIPRNKRICLNCSMNACEDEGHFLFKCPKYSSLRRNMFDEIAKHNRFFDTYGTLQKLIWIMNVENVFILKSICNFIVSALKIRNMTLI